MPDALLQNAAALILQEIIPFDTGEYCIVHANKHKVTIEITMDYGTFLFDISPEGLIQSHFSNSLIQAKAPNLEKIRFVAKVHFEMAHILNFEVNTEGFIGPSNYHPIQLRPVPDDAPHDPQKSIQIEKLAKFPHAQITRFVWGTFEFEGKLTNYRKVSTSNQCSNLAMLFDDLPRIRDETIEEILSLLPKESYQFTKESMLRMIHDNLGSPIWLTNAYVSRVKDSLPTILVDLNRGFHLSHDLIHLPPIGKLRDKFKYIGIHDIPLKTIRNCNFRIVSDGTRGVICPINN